MSRIFFAYAQANDSTWYAVTGAVAMHLHAWFVQADTPEEAARHSEAYFSLVDASGIETRGSAGGPAPEGPLTVISDEKEKLAWIQRVENGRFTQAEDGSWFLRIEETDLAAFGEAVLAAQHYRSFEISLSTGFSQAEVDAASRRIAALRGETA